MAHAWGRKSLSAAMRSCYRMEHHSNIVPWQLLAEEKGVKLGFIPVRPDGTLDLEQAARLITPKTKLLAFTAASNALGTQRRRSCSPGQGRRRKTLVDGARSAHETDVTRWDCDFSCSPHKMLGPPASASLRRKPCSSPWTLSWAAAT